MLLKDEMVLNVRFGWWYYMQVRNLFIQDKRKCGIMDKQLDIDKILLGENKIIINKGI